VEPYTTANAGSDVLAGAVSVLIALLVIHLWEETVWAGFMQTRLERRHSLPVAALLTAVPFAAIHLPLQLIALSQCVRCLSTWLA
jgi:membrane protease YdiL (CAAX protease family)